MSQILPPPARRPRRQVLAGLCAAPLGSALRAPQVLVKLDTDLGALVIALCAERAPKTVANFLAHVDQGLFAGGSFYRIVRPDNDAARPPIHVIQGGRLANGNRPSPLPAIPHESTAETGLRHRDGTISMARGAPGTACSEFFICLGPNPELDAGGRRHPDGQGFAAFGRVTQGLDAFRRLDRAEVGDGPSGAPPRQWLAAPIPFRSVRRHGA